MKSTGDSAVARGERIEEIIQQVLEDVEDASETGDLGRFYQRMLDNADDLRHALQREGTK